MINNFAYIFNAGTSVNLNITSLEVHHRSPDTGMPMVLASCDWRNTRKQSAVFKPLS